MALALVLRNASKFNGTGFLKTARLTPLKTYTTIISAQRNALIAKPLQVALAKNVSPITRTISLTTPKMSAVGGNHSTLWTAERVISILLLGVIPAAFVAPSQVLDGLMAVSVVLHTHWGVESSVTDYLRPAVVGQFVSKAGHGLVYLLSIATLGGLFYIIHNDIGIANTIIKLWSVKGSDKKQ